MGKDGKRTNQRHAEVTGFETIQWSYLNPNVKKHLANGQKLSTEARDVLQKCATEFILFVTGEATEHALRKRAKIVSPEDLLAALQRLGYDGYADVVDAHFKAYARGEKVDQPQSIAASSEAEDASDAGRSKGEADSVTLEQQGTYDNHAVLTTNGSDLHSSADDAHWMRVPGGEVSAYDEVGAHSFEPSASLPLRSRGGAGGAGASSSLYLSPDGVETVSDVVFVGDNVINSIPTPNPENAALVQLADGRHVEANQFIEETLDSSDSEAEVGAPVPLQFLDS